MSIIAVLLRYEEPEFEQTLKCVNDCNLPFIIAERNGYEGMTKAYNDCFKKHRDEILKFDYVWFVSNIIFDQKVVDSLVKNMGAFDALHPSFISDHAHIRPNNTGIAKEAKFIEWTAPIIKTSLFDKLLPDDRMPFWGQDIDWSFKAKANGYKIGVDYGCEIKHTYLRGLSNVHPVTELRKRVRKYWDEKTVKILIEKYGTNWKRIIWE